MILQSLNAYYDRLVDQGKLDLPGWQAVKVSYALNINDDGELLDVFPLFVEETRGKKKILVPQSLTVPARAKKSSGIVSNFLCDNSTYILGVDAKGKPDRSRKCFEACKDLHIRLLGRGSGKPAKAVCAFFERWRPEDASTVPQLTPYYQEMIAGGNLVFTYEGSFIQKDGECRRIWDDYYADRSESKMMRCLVTGEMDAVARTHPSISGVVGGQSSGTSLVSFNGPAFESYGFDGGQGLNAPVSERAAFAYTAALNYMIATPGHSVRLSDMTIVFWSENGEEAYSSVCAAMLGLDVGISEEDLHQALKQLAAGRRTNLGDAMLDPESRFCILGLAPNAARLSVRFFARNTFGKFAENIEAHHNRMQIIRPAQDPYAYVDFWHMLNETVNQKSNDKKASPILAGAVIRAVLLNNPYPELLLDQVEIRIRAEHSVSRGKAAIIKAFLLKKAEVLSHDPEYKEALTVELNENTNYPPYLLGRLFSVLEALQQSANPGINTTIRDRYFNSACATPAIVFPQLIKLAQAHLKKLDGGLSTYYSKQIGEILNRMDQSYPNRLNLYDQGIYQLGYYHQTQKRYMKKEDKENV